MDADNCQLVIVAGEESEWIHIVEQSWRPYGRIQIMAETAVVPPCSATPPPTLFLIDASNVNLDVIQLIKKLTAQYSSVPVVLATASPTWQQARAALHAGAVDYVKRTIDSQSLQTLFAELISRYKQAPEQNMSQE